MFYKPTSFKFARQHDVVNKRVLDSVIFLNTHDIYYTIQLQHNYSVSNDLSKL